MLIELTPVTRDPPMILANVNVIEFVEPLRNGRGSRVHWTRPGAVPTDVIELPEVIRELEMMAYA